MGQASSICKNWTFCGASEQAQSKRSKTADFTNSRT
jgi:hypothetical protein